MENYTKYKLKAEDELKSVLAGTDNLFVIACNKCFKEFETTYEPDCEAFEKIVADQGKTVTGSVKRLSAELSGQVYAKDEARLCYNGTWRIEEVTDYTAWLEGLVDKCENIVLTAKPGETNQPTAEALEYLKTSVIVPAKATLTEGAVTKEQYDAYTALYLQFQQMERTGFAQSLDEGYYYHLRNVWFNKYAAANTTSKTVNHQPSKGNGDNYLWQVVK